MDTSMVEEDNLPYSRLFFTSVELTELSIFLWLELRHGVDCLLSNRTAHNRSVRVEPLFFLYFFSLMVGTVSTRELSRIENACVPVGYDIIT